MCEILKDEPTKQAAGIARDVLMRDADFIIEDGRYVFTADYLLKRGSCCANGCRNCPYRVNDLKPIPHTRE